MTTTAQILDFAEYRQRKAARDAKRAGTPARRFVWSWPSTGQLSVVDFPAPGRAPSMLSQIS